MTDIPPDPSFLGPQNFPGPTSFPGMPEQGYYDDAPPRAWYRRRYYLRFGRRSVR